MAKLTGRWSGGDENAPLKHNAKRRHPEWSKGTVLRELRSGKPGNKVYEEYALECDPNTLKKEVAVWRMTDPEFAEAYEEIMQARGLTTRKGGPRPLEEREPDFADWRVRFCEDLFETGSRLEAAKRSPYRYESIYRMLNEKYSEYDKQFADLVFIVEGRMCAEAEGSFFKALRDAESPKDKAWIASKWLERRDPTRWSRQVEMIHSGTVKHEHQHQVQTREQRLAELMASQQAFFAEHAPKLIEAPPATIDAQVVEAEVVPVESAEV